MKKSLGKYKYPLENFGFEKNPERLVRDREVRPRLNPTEYVKAANVCPECGSELLDVYEDHYACENCPYVDWTTKCLKR